MNNNSNKMSTGIALLLTLGIMVLIGTIIDAFEPKCSMSGCGKDAIEGSKYCTLHEMSYKSYGTPDYNAVYKNSLKRRENHSSESSTSINSTSQSSSSSTSQSSSGSTKSSYSSDYSNYNSYDEGYEDVYDNDDYDWDRYWSDSDYANGVDDAMEDEEW